MQWNQLVQFQYFLLQSRNILCDIPIIYIGGGDTESFKKVADSKPYGHDLKPIKLECVEHVQKRLGTRLRKLRNDMKDKVLSDGERINGKERLTDKICNKMQNYFGMAIRQNTAAEHGIMTGQKICTV